MGWTTEESGIDFLKEKKTLLSIAASRRALGPTQSHTKDTGRNLRGVKKLGREFNYSPPSSADVKNGGAIPPLSHTSSWRGT
jgi:hypothetical protein